MKLPNCLRCNEPMVFVGDYLVKCGNINCSEYNFEFNVDVYVPFSERRTKAAYEGNT